MLKLNFIQVLNLISFCLCANSYNKNEKLENFYQKLSSIQNNINYLELQIKNKSSFVKNLEIQTKKASVSEHQSIMIEISRKMLEINALQSYIDRNRTEIAELLISIEYFKSLN
ncbi:hypothetical protein GVAV_001668 [Gurleya vavrai]